MTAIVAALITGIFAYIAGKRQAEHQVRFTRIYEEQATVVARLFTLIAESEKCLGRYAYPFGTGKQPEREEAAKSFVAMHDYYRANQIWLDQNTCDILDSLFNETNRLFSDMDLLTEPNHVRRAMNLPDDPTERQKMRNEIARSVLQEIPTIRERLKIRFKELLKVSDSVPRPRFYERWTAKRDQGNNP